MHYCNIIIQAGSNTVRRALKLFVCQLNVEASVALSTKPLDLVQPACPEGLCIRGAYSSYNIILKQEKNTSMISISVKQTWALLSHFDEHEGHDSSGTSSTRV